MLKKFFPPQENFFKLFEAASDELVKAAEQFAKLLANPKDAHLITSQITIHEKAADKITFTTYELLHSTFITPFDRYDVLSFTGKLDDIVDNINETSQKILSYELGSSPSQLIALGQLSLKAALSIKQVVYNMHALHETDKINKICEEISLCKNEAESLTLLGVKNLFQNETDIKLLLKYKDIYESTKEILLASKELSNIIKGIALEYA